MVDVKECSVGDVCWALVPSVQRAPMYGTITDIYESENAIQLTTLMNGIRCIPADRAFWTEAEAKAAKKK